ncbi:hypothetical protein BC938DRAFT_476279, partial [Jimgerdemannia flammicorona]
MIHNVHTVSWARQRGLDHFWTEVVAASPGVVSPPPPSSSTTTAKPNPSDTKKPELAPPAAAKVRQNETKNSGPKSKNKSGDAVRGVNKKVVGFQVGAPVVAVVGADKMGAGMAIRNVAQTMEVEMAVQHYDYESDDIMMLDSDDDDDVPKEGSWASMHAIPKPSILNPTRHYSTSPTSPTFPTSPTSIHGPHPSRRNSARAPLGPPPLGPLPDDLYGLAWTILIYFTRHMGPSLVHHLAQSFGPSWASHLPTDLRLPHWTLPQQLDVLQQHFADVFVNRAYGGYQRAVQHVAGIDAFLVKWDHAGRYRDKYGEETGRILQMVEITKAHIEALVGDVEILLHGLVSESEAGVVARGVTGERGTREEARAKVVEWRRWLERAGGMDGRKEGRGRR